MAEKGDDGRPRRVYYLRGVGTARGERIRGGAFGVGLSRNVKGACRTIVENYDPGGARFFFGVTRGSLHRAEHGRPGPQRGALERQHTSRTDEAYRLVPPPAEPGGVQPGPVPPSAKPGPAGQLPLKFRRQQ